MHMKLFAFLFIVAGLLGQPARADVLVLVHGYLSGPQSWDTSGVTAVLQRQGWRHAGVYVAGPSGVHLMPAPVGTSGNRYYTVDLPSEAPVVVQAFQLREMLAAINRSHGSEPVYIAGHSAGGVVARAALVNAGIGSVRALITIASPHLGTYRHHLASGFLGRSKRQRGRQRIVVAAHQNVWQTQAAGLYGYLDLPCPGFAIGSIFCQPPLLGWFTKLFYTPGSH